VLRGCLLALILAACGDNITGTPLAEFQAEADAARCSYFMRCGLFASADTCAAFFRDRPDVNVDAALAAGKVFYNGVAAEKCHAALAAQSCDLSSREGRVLPDACDHIFGGTLDEGETCAFDAECSSGRCDAGDCNPALACCSGTCLARRERADIGGACDTSADCVVDSFCTPEHACAALVAEAGECRADGECDYGLACIGASELQPGNCRAMPLLGESCPYLRCAEVEATCSATSHTCVALGLPGATCASSADCSPFARCDMGTMTCADVPTLGMPCQGACAGEAFCDVSGSMTCAAPLPNTSPCSSDDQCASLFCAEGPVFDACADRQACF
jgi:hypothetical protein